MTHVERQVLIGVYHRANIHLNELTEAFELIAKEL